MNIFVGNLLFDSTEVDVKRLFERFGSVASVAIVMDKKGKKSRGFGFVQMPDDQQALAAIAAVDGKDFMGRALNVSPAHPKSEVKADSGRRKKIPLDFKDQAQPYPQEVSEQKNVRGDTAFNSQSRYKQGRRSRSFMVRRAAAGIKESAMPRKKSHENPMRWRKKSAYPTPWKKTESGESKPGINSEGAAKPPWRKSEGAVKPWRKTEGESKPRWRKTEGAAKPWRKTEGGFKPWEKKEGRAKPWRKSVGEAKPPWRKTEGVVRPWRKTEGEAKPPWRKSEGVVKPWEKKEGQAKPPWRKTEGEAKPWHKSSDRPRQPSFKSRKGPGSYRR